MSLVKVQGNASGTGIFTVAAPATNTDRTLTLPDATGTVLTDSSGVLNIGSGQVYKDASGNVGIGTSSPGAKLNVAAGDAASAANQVNISGGRSLGANVVGSAGSILFTNSYWTSGYGAAYISGMDSGSSGGLLAFATTSNGGGTTGVPTERARITSGGDMLVGTTSTSTPTSSTADVYLGGIVMPPSRRTTGSGANVNIDPTSGIFARSTSSLKYKKDVLNAPWGLADAMNLRAVTYKSVVEADGDTVFGGFIAEEVHAAGLTEFVQYAPDGSPDALAYGNMVALCIKAIQEQQTLITSLTARIAALEGTSNV